jgi:hypothetical protein
LHAIIFKLQLKNQIHVVDASKIDVIRMTKWSVIPVAIYRDWLIRVTAWWTNWPETWRNINWSKPGRHIKWSSTRFN